MKQFQIIYEKDFALTAWIRKIRTFCIQNEVLEKAMLFRFFLDVPDAGRLEVPLGKIREAFPEAYYAGSTSTANIVYGSLTDVHIAITCTIFEDPETQIRILQLPMNHETQEASADTVIRAVKELPWVKAIEIMTTLNDVNMDLLCSALSGLPEEIRIYGGCANKGESYHGRLRDTFVFSSSGEMQNQSAVFILLGGPSLHVNTSCLIGWHQIGHSIPVTASEGNLLIGMNGRPAREVFEEALDLHPGKDFYKLTNVFPLVFRYNGIPYLRIVTRYMEDGSLYLSSYIKEEDQCGFTYGSSEHILEHLEQTLKDVQEFEPQAIQLFSCVARLLFWGDDDVSMETLPFESIAPASGYYTSGELLRNDKDLMLHNVTLVIAALREGEASGEKKSFHIDREELSTQMLVSKSLANFIEMSTKNPDYWKTE